MNIIENDFELCPLCGYKMFHMQACHLKCSNCGAELDCSDKGYVW